MWKSNFGRPIHWLISTQVRARERGRVFTKSDEVTTWRTRNRLTDFNPARVMSTLCRVHGHGRAKDRLFNGDHAGNFLLLRDGRIGCIDYGQKKLTTEERHWSQGPALRDDDTESYEH